LAAIPTAHRGKVDVDGEFLRWRRLGNRRREEEGRETVAELGNGCGERKEARGEDVACKVQRVADVVEAGFEGGWLFATEGK
jgi:hypothetical protein